MTDFASLLVADRGQKARTIHLVDKHSFAGWAKTRPAEDRALLEAHRFDGKTGFAFAILPRGGDFEVVSAVENAAAMPTPSHGGHAMLTHPGRSRAIRSSAAMAAA
jgi:leucyl aminopeptidase